MTSESHNTRFGGIKEDTQDFRSDFNSLLSGLENEIQSKFENINTRLNKGESNLESIITEQVNESIMSIKDSINTATKDENKIETLQEKLAENEKSFNRLGQYNKMNDLEIQGVPSASGDEVWRIKLLEFLNVWIPYLQKVTQKTVTDWANQNPTMQLLDLSIEKIAVLV